MHPPTGRSPAFEAGLKTGTPPSLFSSRSSSSDHKFNLRLADFVLLALASLLPFIPAVMDAYGPVWGAVDNYMFSFPLLSYAAEVLRAGELPLWNRRVFGGTHLLADPQAQVLYPLNFLFFLFPNVVMYNAIRFAHYPLAAWLAYLLCRELGISRAGAIVGGTAWATSGFAIMHPAHFSLVPSLAWSPLTLICIIKLREGIRAGPVLLGGISVALLLTGGHPQFLLYWTMIVGTFVVVHAFWDRGERFSWVLGTTLIYGCGLLLAAVLLGPAFDVLSESRRGLMAPRWQLCCAFGAKDAYVLLFPWWNPPNLLRGLSPEIGFHGYPGFMMMGLALLALVRLRKGTSKVLLPWIIVGVVSLFCLFGYPRAVLVWFAKIPPFGWFRNLSRHGFEFGIAWAMLAAYGADELIRPRSTSHRLYVFLCLSILGAGAALYLTFARRPVPFPWGIEVNPVVWRLPLYLCGLTSVWILLRDRRPALAVCCLLSVHVLDQAGFVASFSHYRYSVRAEGDMVEPLLGHKEAIQRLRETDTRYLSLQVGAFFPLVSNLGALAGVDNATGYNPLVPKGFLSALPSFTEYGLTTSPAPLVRYPQVMDMLAVRYVSVHIRRPEGAYGAFPLFRGKGLLEALQRSTRWRLVLATRHGQLYENTNAVSRAWLVPRIRRTDSRVPGGRDTGIPYNIPDDPRSVAVIEAQELLLGGGTQREFSGKGNIEIVHRTPNSVTYESSTDGQVFAVFSEAYSKRWRLDVDGHNQPIYRTNGMLVGAILPRGEHRLVLHYDPTMFYAGGVVTAITLLCMFGLVVAENRRAQQRRAAASASAWT